ncbi:MAG: hypothetical protein H7X77_03120 [Anaerolineae bacterium]|nr:hypothetical protein [Anaerolineae bacterium]
MITTDIKQDELLKRPGRPLGLTLAILATAFIFSIVPLLRLGLDLLIMQHFNSLTWPSLPYGEGEVEPIFSGGETHLVNLPELLLVSTLGTAFLIVAIFAWRGKPVWIRFILYWGVLCLDVIYTLLILRSILMPVSLEQGLTSIDGTLRSSQIGYLVMIILVSLYLLWYMNRAPARAFYRGYYLPETEAVDTP